MTTILIIEDEAHIRGNVAEVLEYENYEVLFAENGRIGVDLAIRYQPDLIICDVMMPEMDGFEVIEQLQAHPTAAMIPFIFLTALTDHQTLRAGMELGADDYVVKPFVPGELLGTVRTRLAKRAAAFQAFQQLMTEQSASMQSAPGDSEVPPTGQSLIGAAIRGYQIWDVVGEGGAGTVYKAYQGNLGREVAIKILSQTRSSDVEHIRRFQTEAELVARLEHPHVIPLYDYWYDDHNVYLVMRFVRGGSLRHMLESQGHVSLPMAAALVDQIAGALSVAHSVGIVHRDIKPDNILLDERNNAYLTDFGLAKNMLSGTSDTAKGDLGALLAAQDEFFTEEPHTTLYLTDMNTMTGTPAYLSPEQIRGEPLSSRSDIYSLGITLYEMLTGVQPFRGSLSAILQQQVQTPLPSTQGYNTNTNIPAVVDVILRRATAKNPDRRYTDALALAADFRRACNRG